ncbi:lytic transglycosylase [Thiolinea disciformis]|uniref:lytic transglycosylase n=1 Tax=Thiolinea disciformis TaxID=125614 RepID=UPI000377AADF|nr:lytic transglycosylase [Thiolinea disciformis]
MKRRVTPRKFTKVAFNALVIAAGLSIGSSAALAEELPNKVRNYVLKTCDQHSSSTLERKAEEYEEIIQSAAEQAGVNANLIKAVITAETCFRPTAISPQGAAGLMQLMPATALRFGAFDTSVENNVQAGARYLSFLLKRYDGSIHHAIAAYNSGEGTVDRHGLEVPYRETQDYMKRVMNAYYKLGGSDDLVETIAESKSGKSKKREPLVERTVGNKRARFEERKLTGRFAERKLLPSCLKASRRLQRATVYRDDDGARVFYYRVQKNDSLDKIEKLTGASEIAIKRYNDLASSRIKAGQKLKISECRL